MNKFGYAISEEAKNDKYVPISEPNLGRSEMQYLAQAFASGWVSSQGAYVDRFESSFAEFCGTSWGVATSNGTTALHLALVTLGIGEGDEVILPDLTFAATINAVLHSGATPVIVDVEKDSWCIDPVSIKRAISKRTKAVIPVHLYGQPCNMEAIMNIARERKIYVIEDAAEAHGAAYKGKKVGSFGDIGCFSFFANKVVTTGEGGMCLTSSRQLNDRMRVLRDHGMMKNRKYWHDRVGYNYRITNLQAAIGLAQLERIEELLDTRTKIELMYKKALSRLNFIEFQSDDLPGREKITWLVSALIKDGSRDRCICKLQNSKIDARPFFYPLSDMKIYKPYSHSCAISRKISSMGINLPTYRSVNKKTIKKITGLLDGGSR